MPLIFLTSLLLGLGPTVYSDLPVCSIRFSLFNAGFEVEGTMQATSVELHFDPTHLEKSYAFIVADPGSVDTGISIRDKHLKRNDFFDVTRHPKILLRSKYFHRKSRTEFTGTFDLTIKSITREVTIPFTVKKLDTGNVYRASFKLNRLDFSIGEKSITIDDEVKIEVTLTD